MINTNIISAEASTTPQIGVKGKGGKKGESQGLFSKLLAALQHGSPKQNQEKGTLQTTKEEVTHTALIADKPNQKEGNKSSSQSAHDNSNQSLKHQKVKDSEAAIVSVQQAPLVTQSVLQKRVEVTQIVQPAKKTSLPKQFMNKHVTTQTNLQQKPINIYQQTILSQKNENSPTPTQPQNIINKSVTTMAVQAQTGVLKQPIQNMAAKALQVGRATPATTQKNTTDDGVVIKQKGNMQKQKSAPISLNNTTGKDQLTSLSHEDNTLNATKKSLPIQQGITSVKTTAKTDSLPLPSKEPTITKEPLSIQQVAIDAKTIDKTDNSPIRGKELTTAKDYSPSQQVVTDAKTTDKADSSPIRGKEVAVVNTQQRTSSQEQSPASLFTQTIQSKNMDNKGATSQQDFSSNQQHTNASTLGVDSIDNKGKGIDFQAQLTYRSQRSFTPNDAMLAIVKSAKDGKTSLELQLEPANLGKVQVSIQIDTQKQIQVAFTVEQQTSRQALEQHMPQLRLALAQQGLDLGGFSMQMQQQHQEQNQSSTQHTGLKSELLADVDLKTIQENRMGVNIAVDGRLSILA